MRLFCTGFENNSIDAFTETKNAEIVSSSGLDMSGSYALSLGDNDSYAKITVPLSTELYLAFRYRYTQQYYGNGIVTFVDSDGKDTASINLTSSTATINIRRGDYNDTLLDTGDALQPDTTYLIEVRYKPLNSGGVFTVKVDGTEVATYAGDTTAESENIQAIYFGRWYYSSAYCYIDDIVIDDAGWIGTGSRFQAITVTGAGDHAQWDASTGSNDGCVDEIPYSDSDYNSTNVTDEIDSFEMSNLVGDIAEIKSLTLHGRIAYEGVPTPTHIALGLISGVTTNFDSGHAPAVSFANVSRIMETDPNTSAAWIESGVNAIKGAYKAVIPV